MWGLAHTSMPARVSRTPGRAGHAGRRATEGCRAGDGERVCDSRRERGLLHASRDTRWQTETRNREVIASAVKSTTIGPFVRRGAWRPIHLSERLRTTIRDFSLERVFGATFRKQLPLCCRET